MTRGYFGCGILYPQKKVNVGGLLRSAASLGAAFTFTIGGQRDAVKGSDNTVKSQRHIPHMHFQDFESARAGLPIDCPLVAVELAQGATSLSTYQHRERAAYLLGPENGSIPQDIVMECDDVVVIPHGEFCFNVATAGTIVLWHRQEQRAKGAPK